MSLLAGRFPSMAAKYLLRTLGCKVNQYETQRIRELIESLGFQPADSDQAADLAVINSCAVTAGAARKSRQMIRRAARGGAVTFVVGCIDSADAEHLRSLKGVTAVVRRDCDVCATLRTLIAAHIPETPPPPSAEVVDRGKAPRQHPGANGNDVWMKPCSSGPKDPIRAPRCTSSPTDNIVHRLGSVVKDAGALTERITRFAGHQRAFLKVQDGCDAFCTYCIVPRLRTIMAFKPRDLAVAEARDLVRAGHREIVVTGIYLGAYGRATAVRRRFARGPSPLAGLVEALAAVSGLERLRLSSLEPGDVDESLLDVLSRHANCVPHLHLPLQSGSPGVLQRMNRQYTREDYVEVIQRVRSALDRPAITTDIIVGFPDETEEDFELSVDIARQARFVKIHAFPFSPRAGTAAARRPDRFVSPEVVRRRMLRLGEVERDCSLAFRRDAVGTAESVLVEAVADRGDASGKNARWHCRGRAARYFEVSFESPTAIPAGEIVPVRLTRATPESTEGEPVIPGGGLTEVNP